MPPGGGAKLAEVRGSGFAGLAGVVDLPGAVEGAGLVPGCDDGIGDGA